MTPYYEHYGITIYHGDCREILPELEPVDLVLTDPPYGIGMQSGMKGRHGNCRILGDGDTKLRDSVLDAFNGTPSIVFGSWKTERPKQTRCLLIWEKGNHVGMGDLSMPWKPNHEEIYVIGYGFKGKRKSAVLRHLAVAGCVGHKTYRHHPTEKPKSLIIDLLQHCPDGTVLDPFMGSGTTLVAAKELGRKAIGIEIEEKYCEIAAKRLSQEVLPFASASSG